MFFNQTGNLAQQAASLRLCHSRPWAALERAAGGLTGAVDVDSIALGDQRPRLAGVWIDRFERLARCGIAPLTIDIDLVLLELGRDVLHGIGSNNGAPVLSKFRLELVRSGTSQPTIGGR